MRNSTQDLDFEDFTTDKTKTNITTFILGTTLRSWGDLILTELFGISASSGVRNLVPKDPIKGGNESLMEREISTPLLYWISPTPNYQSSIRPKVYSEFLIRPLSKLSSAIAKPRYTKSMKKNKERRERKQNEAYRGPGEDLARRIIRIRVEEGFISPFLFVGSFFPHLLSLC